MSNRAEEVCAATTEVLDKNARSAGTLVYSDGERHPVDNQGWPVWPLATAAAHRRLGQALESGRWSISGASTGTQTMERAFAEAFACYIGTAHCVPVASGSSALVAALAALGIGVGDEVIVPGLTWVAPAVAVLAVNATPVIVDVDLETLCISPEAIEAAVTDSTRAIIVVHLYASAVDMEAVKEISNRHGIRIVEDCAQSHGTIYDGRMLGSLGDVGIFSMHQGKPLTSGEGGAACTDDPILAERIEQMRANGRKHRVPPAQAGDFDLMECGDVTGTNMAISEFQAALLLDGLGRLDEQVSRRAAAVAALDPLLAEIEGVRPVGRPAAVTRQSVYHYPVRFEPDAFGGATPEALSAFLTRELGVLWSPTYPPMDRNQLWNPGAEGRFALDAEHQAKLSTCSFSLKNSAVIHRTTVIVHHRALLAGWQQLKAIPRAFVDARAYFGDAAHL